MCTFNVRKAALEAPTPTSRVSLFKLTMEEHFESDNPFIKAKFTSLDPTKTVYPFWDTGHIFFHAIDQFIHSNILETFNKRNRNETTSNEIFNLGTA